jgi:general stress protein 26
MHETPGELAQLQTLLDLSMVGAGPHLKSIIGEDRRVAADQLCARLQGMRLLSLSTVTADGRPLVGPVDGYLLHGLFYFTSASNSVRIRHIRARPAVSAMHLPSEELAVTVHGKAQLFTADDPNWAPLRQAMLDEYLPKQGPAFEEWLDTTDVVAARIIPEKMFTFQMTAQ